MYFPYFRCKQFELLAIRELAAKLGESRKISPVLEPLKKTTAPLVKTLDSLILNNVNFTLILNPIHGELILDTGTMISLINSLSNRYTNFQLGILITPSLNLEHVDSILDQIKFLGLITLIHRHRANDIEALTQWVEAKDIRYNLFNENFPVRRYREIISRESKVIFEDKFIQQTKNSDYSNNVEEFFSDDHLYFEEDGYVGFGDYLTIGDDYSESGFLPYAVAIHLTYAQPDGKIYVRHFVSDSNSDNSDVAGKFGEALEKLIEFIDEAGITTEAANEFRILFREGHYPGLGSIKKLSIKNHLELIISLLH